MEFELWWLLALPLFFVLGWLAARIDIRHVMRESRKVPKLYMAGLKALLNGQQDLAVQAFEDAARADVDNLELHFVLGSLFRRRGDLDRAVHIHETLARREDLGEALRLRARLALGEDYLQAGLLDRAEAVYTELAEIPETADEANQRLLQIYEQERDWEKSIQAALAFPHQNSLQWCKNVANFHCELAARALVEQRYPQARQHLQEAMAVNRQSVRASVLLGDLEVAEGQDQAAIDAWKRIESQNAAYLSLVADKIIAAYQRLQQEEQGVALLKAWLELYPSLDLLSVVFEAELQKNGVQAAYDLARDQLQRHPTVLGLDKLLQAAALRAEPERRPDIEMVRGLIQAHTRRVARYRCDCCGFKARQFYWRCPACGGWESYPPKRTEEFDLEP